MANQDIIKIPEKVYVGFQGRRTVDEVPLGFMTPYTDDMPGQKRRSTVDNWARGHGSTKTFNSVTLDNNPMIGFRIGRSIRRSGGWNGSGASYVRIEDPRGFELEITIENLIACMECAIIEQTVILQECVWGRNGTRNILLPTNSEPFRNSIVTTSLVAQALLAKDITIGDEVVMVTGESGVYMGNMNGIVENYRNVSVQSSKKSVLRIIRNGLTRYKGFTNFKVLKVVKLAETVLTTKDSEVEIFTEMMVNPYCCESGNTEIKMWVAGAKGVTQGPEINHSLTIDGVKLLMAKKNGVSTLDGLSYTVIGDIGITTAQGRFKLDYRNFYYDRNDNDFGFHHYVNGIHTTVRCPGKFILNTINRDLCAVDESEILGVDLMTESVILANGKTCPIYK